MHFNADYFDKYFFQTVALTLATAAVRHGGSYAT